MDFLSSLFNKNTNAMPDTNKPTCSTQTCLLEQGKQLLNLQTQREKDLNIQTKLMGEKYNTYEGFTSDTLAKNTSELTATTTLSDEYGNKIARYNNDYPNLITDARAYTKMTNRNKEVNRNFKEHVDLLYDIRADKEGCYKKISNSSFR